MMPSIPQLLIVLAIVVLVFGAKRLRNLGGDLGAAVKGFKSAVKGDGEAEGEAADQARIDETAAERVADTENTTAEKDKV